MTAMATMMINNVCAVESFPPSEQFPWSQVFANLSSFPRQQDPIKGDQFTVYSVTASLSPKSSEISGKLPCF